MRVRDLLRLPKAVTIAGTWKVVTRQAKMSPTAFRLSKRSPYTLSRHWHWRVDELAAGSYKFQLLTAYRPDTEEYRAVLGQVVGDGLRIVSRLEYHGDHPGWHAHSHCGDHEEIAVGETAPRTFTRVPAAENSHRRETFDISDNDAVHRAYQFYRVKPPKNWALTE